jgi:3-oxoacyl-[acyl-carrier-protein] synthase-3
MFKAKINSIAVSHGKKVVDNEYYFEHFKKRGKDVEHFFKDTLGKDKRYMIDNDKENSLTLATDAAESALKKSGLTGSDIDMIIFSSQLPEYVAPPSSIYLHGILKGKKSCICYDVNANCAGMTICYEQAVKYMSVTPHVKKTLIVGCDYISITIDPDDEKFYGHYGDAACAIILEKTDTEAGLIDSMVSTSSDLYDYAIFPPNGVSNMLHFMNMENRYLKSKKISFSVPAEGIYSITSILERNNLKIDDISMFLLSQHTFITIQKIRENLGIKEKRSIYIGDEYGYTGTTSPFIALFEAEKRGLIKRGDYYIMWTIGAGIEDIGVLCRY